MLFYGICKMRLCAEDFFLVLLLYFFVSFWQRIQYEPNQINYFEMLMLCTVKITFYSRCTGFFFGHMRDLFALYGNMLNRNMFFCIDVMKSERENDNIDGEKGEGFLS